MNDSTFEGLGGYGSSESDGFTQTPSGSFGWGWVILLVLLTALAVAFLIAKKKRDLLHYTDQLNVRGVKIVLPKQTEEDDKKRDPKELTGLMEPVFSAVQHFYVHKWWKRVWEGQPTFSFEVAVHGGEVHFYLFGPADLLPNIEQQVHAQYPSAQITPSDDHALFTNQELISAVGALALTKSLIFPIRTYRTLDNDSLNGMTNSLSKVGDENTALIQVLVQPTLQSWQHKIEQALQNVQQGKSFEHNATASKKAVSFAKDITKTVSNQQSEAGERTDAMNTMKGNVRLTAMQEQQAKLMVEKGSKIGLKTQIRCIARARSDVEASTLLQSMLAGFAQFNAPEANSFRMINPGRKRLLIDSVMRSFSPAQPTIILNTEELTSVFHYPNRHLDTPNVHWLGARKLAPPVALPPSGLRIGYSQFRGAELPVNLTPSDRMRHVYAIGSTGVGKTNLYQNMVLQDIRDGHGVCYMDPNGDAVEWILKHIPKERAEDVILFDPSDTARPMALNMMEYDPAYPEHKTMVINEVMSIFDKLYDLRATGGPIFEQYMRNAMQLIMDDPETGNTLMEIPKVLAQEDFRKLKLSRCKNQVVVDFWVKEAEKAGGEAALQNIVPYITSKLTQFTSSDLMRPIVGQQESAFNFRKIMDEGKILLVSLPKGLLGDMSAQLLGMIISGKIQIAAFSRQNQPEAERRPFYLYVDEFQNFTSKTFATILSEARKYALGLNITHQYIKQLDEDTRNAVFGNVGNIICWRIGAEDAEFMSKILDPLQVDDLVNVEKFNFYAKILINGAPTKPFNIHSYPPDPAENAQLGEAIRQLSRLKYGRDREVVEAEIRMRAKSAIVA